MLLFNRLLYLIFCVVVLAECFLNGRSMRTGQKRSVNMITPTEILTKRTCELYQSFTNRTHIRNGRRFDQSEISQIIEKNICCGVILSGLIQLKSIPRTEYIVLPYNTRASTLWILFDDGILSCQKRGYSN